MYSREHVERTRRLFASPKCGMWSILACNKNMPTNSCMTAMKLRLLAVMMLVASLAGCSTPVPPRQPVEAGIFDQPPPQSRATSVPGGRNVFVGVLLSRNAAESIRYMQRRHDVAHDGNVLMREDYVAANKYVRDPDFVIKWIMTGLGERFGTVRAFDGMAELSAAQPDVIALLDMEVQLADWGQSTVSMKNRLRFYDSRGRFIAEAAGNGSRTYGTDSADTPAQILALAYSEKLILIEALEALDQSLDDVVAKPIPAPNSASDIYDQCMRSAVRVSDGKLRVQAIGACDSAK